MRQKRRPSDRRLSASFFCFSLYYSNQEAKPTCVNFWYEDSPNASIIAGLDVGYQLAGTMASGKLLRSREEQKYRMLIFRFESTHATSTPNDNDLSVLQPRVLPCGKPVSLLASIFSTHDSCPKMSLVPLTFHSRWPHGCCYSVMALFSAYGSLYMNFNVIMSCFFHQITKLKPDTGELIMSSRQGFGMLARQISYGEQPDYQQCLYYPEEELKALQDNWMKYSTHAAYACAVLQVIACAVLSTTCCCAYSRVTFERWLMWTYIWASCFMALTFLMYGTHNCTENDCDMANGGGFAISSWMFLLCCANMVKNMGQPPPDDMVDPDDDEDNLWYDDDADRFPKRYEDDYDEYGYEEEEESYDEEDEFAYDNEQQDDRGVEMQDADYLDPKNDGGMVAFDPDTQQSNNKQAPPPPDGGGMVAYNPDDPNAQQRQWGDGTVPHSNPSDPYAQSPPPPPPGGTGMMPYNPDDPYTAPPQGEGMVAYDPNDPYAQQPPQSQPDPYSQSPARVGDRDGPELI